MTGSSLSQYLSITPFLVLFVGLFIYSRDLVHKQLALFIASYMLFVVFSEYFFGMPFARKSAVGAFEIDAITPTLVLFWFGLFFTSNTKLGGRELDTVPLRLPGGRTTTVNTLILSLPIMIFLVYYIGRNGIRVSGRFMDFRGERSVLTDYMFVYYAALVAYFRNSRFLLALGMIAALGHILSAERMRAFVYIILMLINFTRLDTHRHLSSVIFISGFFIATLVGQLRSGGVNVNLDYNVTHFGSVTVSSLYLLDFGSVLDAAQKIKFLIGTLVGNVFPSALVPESYNIRKAIYSFADIPGGGWLPIFLSIQAGILGSVSGGMLVGSLYKKILKEARTHSRLQPAFYAATLVFIATTPRWFMYTPFQILKMPLYAFVLAAILIFLGRVTSKRAFKNGR